MNQLDASAITQQIEQQKQQIQGLQLAVYSRTDPSLDTELFAQLTDAEQELQQLEHALASIKAQEERELAESSTRGAARGASRGAATTGLQVDAKLRMNPLPTGAYHLMDPESDPLLTVQIANSSNETRRVCVKAYIEGLSAEAVRTVELEAWQDVSLNLQPTLFPERAHAITEVQRATLHVIAEDLDGKPETHETHLITCLSRNASFNGVRRPDSGQTVDLSHYYGAWVTPHAEAVQKRIRRAVELIPDKRMLGYQGDPDGVTQQVAALYQALREAEIVYVNSVIDYGAPTGLTTQRTRLPRESLAARSANCIDGTVLMASMIEGVSLNPGIVLVRGHAFVAWEAWQGSNEWRFLETTMIGTNSFQDACESGQRQYEQYAKFNRDRIKLHSLRDLRTRGIWPME